MIEKEEKSIFEIWSNELTKIYGKGKQALEAVSEIDLRVKPGIHGFLGPNGAGKTTTINMLVGAISITKGTAKIREKKAGSVAAKQLIGFLPQDPVFYEDMTGEDYLIYMGQLGGLQKQEAKRKAQELLDFFDLFTFRNKEIETYSGGMKQKIGIAAALIHDPKILILDEPTANLDPLGRADVIQKIKSLSDKISVFVSSHILSEIEQMCDDVTMIDLGKIIISDTIRNIKKKFISNLYILDTNMNEKLLEQLSDTDFISSVRINELDGKLHIIPKDPEKLRDRIPQMIIKNKASLYSFHQPELSLQDIFMEIMSKNKGVQK
ncbi:MAG: ATP-binding cassette domain-containing protein [Promethearchaeota archaeon]